MKLHKLFLLFVLAVFAPGHTAQKVLLHPVVVDETNNVPQPVIPEIKPPKIVLLTIDGVRWQEIFNGTDPLLYKRNRLTARELLPNMYHYFVDNGMVIGRDSSFIASGPAHISLPGYLEIMRGRPSLDCISNDCSVNLGNTIVDTFEDAAVFGSWDYIGKAVSTNSNKFVINCGVKFRSTAWKQLGQTDSPSIGQYFEPYYRPDFMTRKLALDYLKIHQPDFLWVALGDTDEWAHANNYDKYLEALVNADSFINQIVTAPNFDQNTAVIVTADHGRSNRWQNHGWDLASAKLWLMVAGPRVSIKGFVKSDKIKSLSDISFIIHKLRDVNN
jgi:Metalloenzyme superfamily